MIRDRRGVASTISPRISPSTTSLLAFIRPSTVPVSAITTSDDEVTSPRKVPSIRTGSLKINLPETFTPWPTATRVRSCTHPLGGDRFPGGAILRFVFRPRVRLGRSLGQLAPGL